MTTMASLFAPCRNSLRALLLAFAMMGSAAPAWADSRIKDIADFEGVRDNMLVGYGLVVGLNGTGDASDMAFTQQSMIAMLERLGVNTRDLTDKLKAKNVAAVMVTAKLPGFTRQGSRIDVQVSAMGDSKSLSGGTLLVTPLLGADGEIYAVAQGSVASGYSASGAAASVTKNIPTSGRVANGAIVEREINFDMGKMERVRISLRNPDLTTSRRVAEAVNSFLGQAAARSTDPTTIEVGVPPTYKGNVVGLLTDIEGLRVQPDQQARVLIDEQNGVIVMGQNVRIDPVAIAQGNLTIRITETPQVSQPSPFATAGTTTTVNRTDIQVDEGADKKLTELKTGVTMQDLIKGLNELGVGPRDMIAILQAIKAAGALQADIEVM
ncbi:MAG: flagellar basal body P-ring protein FlgI [Alphaproteobacteria bacterium]|nr:flagellar basal body P-ring protein FlgI [Alphaproteobacteria bacterium]